MPPQISPARVVKGIELSHKSKRYKYFIPKESGHNYVYIDPIEGVKMDSPHAKLRLSGDTDLELRNCAGNYQTFIKKKDKEEFDRVLVSVYTKVHDGDRLIFGTPSDLSVEFQVKVLYDVLKETSQQLKTPKALEKAQSDKSTKTKDPPVQNKKSPSDKKDVQAKKPLLRKTRSADNMNLKPPADDKKVKRKSDGNLQQKQKTQEQNEKKKKTHNLSLPQILDDIKECSSSTQLGDGYNALTRTFTGHCALAARTPDKSAKELPLEDFNSDVFVLNATSSVLSADEVGFGTGARISTDVSLRAKYDELASMQWDVSKVFVKYVRDGKYGWQPIKSAVRYRRGVDIHNPSFWTEYGDYYVSDVQRWFGCCVVMVFHIEHLSDIDQAQTDIEARLRDIFEARAHSSTKLIEDMRWSMHRVFCSCYGYSQDILSQSMGLSDLSDVLKFLDKINSVVPPGVARRVKLTRYLNYDS
ncbi:hypothetical protein BDQ17DRAFT_948447 [Cyathus striatus]|nr:hypothetical protein BDQ17DRAFT_948447 [Cyathus striatus]